jgi:hypothetical protein
MRDVCTAIAASVAHESVGPGRPDGTHRQKVIRTEEGFETELLGVSRDFELIE